MYMDYAEISDISRELGVSVHTIRQWRSDGGWAPMREEEERALLEDRFGRRRRKNHSSADMVTEQMERGLKHLAARPEPPTVQELERLNNIRAVLEKENRLDMGKSTENVSINASLTMDRVREILASDPFMQSPVEAEFEDA